MESDTLGKAELWDELMSKSFSLRKLLISGIVLILVAAMLLSALGTSGLVRSYLWKTGAKDLQSIARAVKRVLENPRMRNRGRFPERGLRRFGARNGRPFLFRSGEMVKSAAWGERDWSQLKLSPSGTVRVAFYDEQSWQVYSLPVDHPEFDHVMVVRPWGPSLKIVRNLIGYQVGTTLVVLVLALFAVVFLAGRVIRPLRELQEWSAKVGTSESGVLKTSKISEVADLQTSFEVMAKRVEESLVSQRRFVADASHELKTPLTAIQGMLELLESRPDMEPKDREQALSVAKKESQRMGELVADLLLLSRAQSHRSGDKTQLVLAPLISEELATLKVLFPKQEFVEQLDEQASWLINEAGFCRILRNLVENAAKYGEGKPIRVRLERADNSVILKVEDQGPGLESSKMTDLFERFYRADDGRARSAGGFGLGLPIVKALVVEAGGEVHCHSELGKGTTFEVVFKKS